MGINHLYLERRPQINAARINGSNAALAIKRSAPNSAHEENHSSEAMKSSA
jgi:hypothetical protein